MLKKATKGVLNRLGFDLTRINRTSQENNQVSDEVQQMIESVRPYTMVSDQGLRSLYEQALFCEKNSIAGAFVECGVWKGGAMGLMALVNLKHGVASRPLHLFDSFEEICEPNHEVDGARAIEEVKAWAKTPGYEGNLKPLTGFYDWLGGPGSVEQNRELLEGVIRYQKEALHFHKGWFQETLPQHSKEIEKIAILRLDADWYASTKICLDYLFDKVVSGGFVIIDDYGTYEGCRRAVDEFLARQDKPYFLNYVTSDLRYIIAL